jgi:hypothetical protein
MQLESERTFDLQGKWRTNMHACTAVWGWTRCIACNMWLVDMGLVWTGLVCRRAASARMSYVDGGQICGMVIVAGRTGAVRERRLDG